MGGGGVGGDVEKVLPLLVLLSEIDWRLHHCQCLVLYGEHLELSARDAGIHRLVVDLHVDTEIVSSRACLSTNVTHKHLDVTVHCLGVLREAALIRETSTTLITLKWLQARVSLLMSLAALLCFK